MSAVETGQTVIGEEPPSGDRSETRVGQPGLQAAVRVAAAARHIAALEWVRDLAALAIILGCVLIFFRDAVLFRNIFWEPDTLTFYYPVTRQLDDALRQGILQLWTPYIFGGFHLFADGESGTLYPPRLLFLTLLNAEDGTIWLRVNRFFLAGAFAYFLTRQLGVRRYGATIAALVFAFGSFLVAQLHHTNLASTAIWLPLILLFIEKACLARGFRRYALLSLGGVALGFASLAVHLQPVLFTLFGLACYAVFRAFTVPAGAVPWTGWAWSLGWGWPPRLPRPRPSLGVLRTIQASAEPARRAVGYCWPRLWYAAHSIAIVVGVGLGIAAVQLLPLYELTRFSFRGYRLSYEFATTFSATPHNLLTLVFPYFFRTAEGDPWSLWTFWETTIYVGVAPLALGLLAVLVVRNRYIAFFGVFGLLALLLSFGDYLPVKIYWLFWNLPVFSFVRAPGRFIFLFVLAMAVLAGFGAQWLVDNLRSESMRSRAARRTLLGFTAGFAILGALLAAGLTWTRGWMLTHGPETIALINTHYMSLRRGNYLLNPDMVQRALLFNTDLDNPRTEAGLVLMGATVILLAGWALWPRGRGLWQNLLLGLVAADLLFFASGFHPLMSTTNLMAPTPAARFLIERNGPHRVYTRWPAISTETNRMLPYGVASVGGYSSLESERHREYMRYIERGNLVLLDLMNVRYIVAAKETPAYQQAGYKVVFEDSEVRIYENPHPLPRVMLLPRATIARSYVSVPDWLVDKRFDLTKIAVVEEAQSPFRDPQIRSVAPDSLDWAEAAKLPAPGRAELTSYEAQRLEIQVRADQPSLLLVTDAYHPGWRAYVDGQPEKIYLTDYLFRGVYIPPGDHKVEMVFDPLSVKVGAAISGSVVVCLILFLVIGWLRTRETTVT